MKKLCSFVAVIVAASAPLSVSAAEMYAGGSFGSTTLDWDALDEAEASGASVDDSDTGFKLFIGSRINENFAVEGFYADLGEATASAPGITAKLDADSFGVAAVGILPVNEKVELFAKIGFQAWDATASATGIGSESDDGTDLMFGAGVSYKINKVTIRGEFEQFQLDDADVNMLSAGVAFTF
tara:strand:- start:342 stop:890 length:549 start_codon:yes stop_codon:yes gene_type:complete